MEENVSSTSALGETGSTVEMSLVIEILITGAYIIGGIANTAALWILHKSAKNRNKKHVLLLRCLATNDLVAQIGMLLLLNLKQFKVLPLYWSCVGYVLLRAFGIGSGCVAFVMALERMMALTKPFLYHQLVTYRILKRFVFCLWCGGALLTYFPLFGFGLYYHDGMCFRYRDATELWDIIYAYMVFVFGTGLCICIALYNITVILELSRIRSQTRVLVRRVSRSIINNQVVGCASRYQTPEEVAFSKLMAVICIIFIVCWAPQMISIPMAQFCRQSNFCRIFSRIADILMCLYFALNPYVYVLQQYMEQGRYIWPCFRRRSMTSLPSTTVTSTTPTSVLLHPPSFTIDVM